MGSDRPCRMIWDSPTDLSTGLESNKNSTSAWLSVISKTAHRVVGRFSFAGDAVRSAHFDHGGHRQRRLSPGPRCCTDAHKNNGHPTRAPVGLRFLVFVLHG